MPFTPEQIAFLQGQYRKDQPFTATQGQAIPQQFYRNDQPQMMPIGGDRINWETANPAERDKALAAMQGRMQNAMKGFALPDVSKYGYSPESQGRVEGAGYLRETPVGVVGGGTAPAPGNAPMGAAPAADGPRGLFGGGRNKPNILGIIGDALLTASGRNPQYMPAIQEQRMAAAKAQNDAMLAQYNREANMQDWRTKYDYELKNPKPVNNDTVNDYNFIMQNLGEEAAKNYLRQMGDKFVTTTLPNDQFYAGPQSGLAAALGGVQQGDAPSGPQEGATATNPKTGQKVQFKGGQWVPMGGGVGNGTGNFLPNR